MCCFFFEEAEAVLAAQLNKPNIENLTFRWMQLRLLCFRLRGASAKWCFANAGRVEVNNAPQ